MSVELEQPCENCAGTGWIVVEEGNVSRARRCACFRDSDGDKLASAAKIPARYQNCDFDNYFEQKAFGQQRTKNLLMNFAADYPLVDDEIFREKSILLAGGAGRGKTHLAVAVLKALLKKGVPCLFVDFHELLADIRNSYDELSQTSEYQILQPLLKVEVLLLDDLGSQRMSGWVQDTVFHIINLRYNQRRPMIVTTNLAMEVPSKTSPGETLQDRLGYKVISRLYEMCTSFELDGADYRKEVRKAGGDFLRNRLERNQD
jgi:DNA replication protein DnaC